MLKSLLISSVILIVLFSQSYAQTQEELQAFIENAIEEDKKNPAKATVIVISNTAWDGTVTDSDHRPSLKTGTHRQTFTLECIPGGGFDASFTPISGGTMSVYVVQDGKILASAEAAERGGTASVSGTCVGSFWGGGCLIATAIFGSEMASQVQELRELRDDSLLRTSAGAAFMSGFNQLYYSFSPTIADWERQNPAFKETVKITITPLLASLSILNYVELDSEAKVLGYGISMILLNIGMYFVAPAIIIIKIRSKFS